MMTSFVCSLALMLAQDQDQEKKLEIVNPRTTYGYLGAVRSNGIGVFPGDITHFSFDVKNLKLDSKGRAAYSIAIEVYDDQGHLFYQQKPYNSVAHNYFGGDTLPCSAQLNVPLDAKPGIYDLKVTVRDRSANTSAVLEVKGKVREPDFGLIRVGTFADPEGRTPVPPVGVMGGTFYVNFSAVGFARDPKTHQPDLAVELRIIDKKGQPTFSQPLTGAVKEGVPENARAVPLQFGLTMNRVGNFTVELRARCLLCGKTTTLTFPVRILAQK